jgi:hypothetical protein
MMIRIKKILAGMLEDMLGVRGCCVGDEWYGVIVVCGQKPNQVRNIKANCTN